MNAIRQSVNVTVSASVPICVLAALHAYWTERGEPVIKRSGVVGKSCEALAETLAALGKLPNPDLLHDVKAATEYIGNSSISASLSKNIRQKAIIGIAEAYNEEERSLL